MKQTVKTGIFYSMTSFSKENIISLAKLSNIEVSESEIDGLTEDLQNIIKYIDMLSELDTDGVEPTYQVGEMVNVWREDEVESELDRETLMKITKDNVKDNQIKVPKVL